MSRRTRAAVSDRAATRVSATLVPLNLVYSYPVHWSRYQVLRDLIQNFYDAVGPDAWSRGFSWARRKDELVVEVPGIGFSYEWLLHIGASTKTDAAPGRFAGFFGEGFKIAALCAHCDHGWEISMASRDWQLEVTSTEVVVDGARLPSLGYRVRRRSSVDRTRLRLRPFVADDEALLEAVLLSFFYPEPPVRRVHLGRRPHRRLPALRGGDSARPAQDRIGRRDARAPPRGGATCPGRGRWLSAADAHGRTRAASMPSCLPFSMPFSMPLRSQTVRDRRRWVPACDRSRQAPAHPGRGDTPGATPRARLHLPHGPL